MRLGIKAQRNSKMDKKPSNLLKIKSANQALISPLRINQYKMRSRYE